MEPILWIHPDGERYSVSGELDLASGPILGLALFDLGTRRGVLDLSRVTFVDCSGLHALIAQRRSHVGLIVDTTTLATCVRRIIDLSGDELLLSDRIAVAPNEAGRGPARET